MKTKSKGNIEMVQELSTVEEKEAACFEADILTEMEFIAQKKSKKIPLNQCYFDGETGFWYEKTKEVAAKMKENETFKDKIMFQFKMCPSDDREKRGFVKGIALQRFIAASVKERANLSQQSVSGVTKDEKITDFPDVLQKKGTRWSER